MNTTGFWAMGIYGRYVWPCFAFVMGVLVWEFMVGAAFSQAGARARAACNRHARRVISS